MMMLKEAEQPQKAKFPDRHKIKRRNSILECDVF